MKEEESETVTTGNQRAERKHLNAMPLVPSRLVKPIRKLRKLLKASPDDIPPNGVHDIRTYCRRLEPTLSAIDSGRGGELLLKRLSPLRKLTGKVRDMDVLTSLAATLETNDDDGLVRLLEDLGVKKMRAAQKLSKVITDNCADLRKRLKRYSDWIDDHPMTLKAIALAESKSGKMLQHKCFSLPLP